MVRKIGFYYWCLVIHVTATAIGTLLGVLGFPFLNGIFVQLDSVNCVCGSSLALMAFPDAERIGFIDLNYCAAFLLMGIIFNILLFIIAVLVILKKRSAMVVLLVAYVFDLAFLIVHHIAFPDMISLQTLGQYTILSFLYKLLGIVVILLNFKQFCSGPTSNS